MSLGAALLQPQAFRHPTPDLEAALIEDVLRLVTLVGEDAATGGPTAPILRDAFLAMGPGLQAQLEPRLAAAQAALLGQLSAPRTYLDELIAATAAVRDDPTAIVDLLRKLLADIKALTQSLTLPRIRNVLESLRGVAEDDLLLSPAFLSTLLTTYLDGAIAKLAAAPPAADPAQRRRLRLATAILARIRLHIASLPLPGIAMEPLARLLDDLLHRSGITDALDQISCAMDALEGALAAALAAGTVVRPPLQPINAGLVQNGIAEFSYYASWILSDEQLPLLGLSDVKDAKALVQTLRQPPHSLAIYFRDKLTPDQRSLIDGASPTTEPGRDLQLTALAVFNQAMQREPILALPSAATLPALAEASLSDEIKKLRGNYLQEQDLLLYNRRVLEAAFPNLFEALGGSVGRWVGRTFLGILAWPRQQVFVTADRRFVMCDDMPMLSGTDLAWHDAPLFAEHNPGQFHYNFGHAGAEACEILAQVLFIASEAGKAIWHLIDLQPGHRVQGGIVGGMEIADTLQQVLFGKPLSGHFLELGSFARGWGKSLDSAVGLKGITTLIASFQGKHSTATGSNIFRFWLITLLSDIVRVVGPIKTIGTGREVVLSFVTLLNAGKAPEGPQDLPPNPPANHLKQDPIVGLVDTLFAMLLAALYDRDNYSILIWSKDGIGDRRKSAMLGHWLGGSLGMGIASGAIGSGLARLISWTSDWGLFFKTVGISAGKSFLLFWIFNYLFKENSTDGGKYRPGGGSFKGYPSPQTSPYRLPYAGGTSLMVSQANLGLFSHNLISNMDFVTGNSATLQAYAYDFGHDFDEGIACSRAGVVWSFAEGIPDSDESDWNFIIIRHTGIDPTHDDFGSGPVQTYAVYGHLATNGVTRAAAFGGTAPTPESTTPGGGTPVAQGAIIGLAGDTGLSFHNHLHMHILPDNGSGQPDMTVAIPFVFKEVPGDGVPKSRTWYTSENV